MRKTTFERQQRLYETDAAPRARLDTAIRDLQVANANRASCKEAAAALAQLGGNPDMPVDSRPRETGAGDCGWSGTQSAAHLHLAPFDGIPNNVENIAVGAVLNAGHPRFRRINERSLHRGQHQETDLTM